MHNIPCAYVFVSSVNFIMYIIKSIIFFIWSCCKPTLCASKKNACCSF
ncbi:hypothetical protein DCAR_0520588 [Daucus carota subsp. sativus]|uniref:Uncharacterized protein n=1 Tax=Daucus carota subsp. sativus TaxID=79200 RepID=A0AAF1B274_DAUCS|nr:hypothetical protein DCAR_0520588 [Daucus carota subsp. sativus]